MTTSQTTNCGARARTRCSDRPHVRPGVLLTRLRALHPLPDTPRPCVLGPAAGDCTTISYQVKQAYER